MKKVKLKLTHEEILFIGNSCLTVLQKFNPSNNESKAVFCILAELVDRIQKRGSLFVDEKKVYVFSLSQAEGYSLSVVLPQLTFELASWENNERTILLSQLNKLQLT
jgi:hypothetical protein